MNMRSFLNILEGVERVQIGNNVPFRVYSNPSTKQFAGIGRDIRMIVDHLGDLYAWDAYEATHDEVEEAVAIQTIASFDLSGDLLRFCSGSEGDLENSNLLRAFGGHLPKIV